MARTDDDTWAITESVGITALQVAAARAAETASAHPLITDRFARMFMDAAGTGVWDVYADPTLAEDIDGAGADVAARARRMADFMAVRTLFFDEFFRAAAADGIRQVVLLASGLDARAWRLRWPAGTTVYELDQPKVLDFKATTLRRHDEQPAAQLTYVPVDLRRDWPPALRDSGFDPASPTAWSAEGLLRYLPAHAQDLLFDRIHALSAAGSRLAADTFAAEALNPERLTRRRDQLRRLRSVAARVLQTDVPDLEGLWYADERTDVAGWLGEHGWNASVTTLRDLLTRHGRDADSPDLTPSIFVSARLAAGDG